MANFTSILTRLIEERLADNFTHPGLVNEYISIPTHNLELLKQFYKKLLTGVVDNANPLVSPQQIEQDIADIDRSRQEQDLMNVVHEVDLLKREVQSLKQDLPVILNDIKFLKDKCSVLDQCIAQFSRRR
jgi:hypothetical protein